MANFKIAVINGDGIGPEVTAEAIKILEKIGKIYNHSFNFEYVLAGGCAIDKTGECLPEKTIEICKNSDSVLLGAVGGHKWDFLSGDKRPERALLGLREKLNLYANLRPSIIHNALISSCPLKDSIVDGGIDIMIVRELTGGIYFGERGYREGKYGNEAYDIECYSEKEVERIARKAFEIAMKRNKKVISVDKANVLESSRLWRKVVTEVSKEFPDVSLEHMYVDNAAMQLIKNPKQFDVLLTSNIFGDILSDEASMISGSIGMLPSASLNDSGFGMYEPIHGSAPDIAGKDIANPIASILSASMMLKYSFCLYNESDIIERAVESVLKDGYRTQDIYTDGFIKIGTQKMGQCILERIKSN